MITPINQVRRARRAIAAALVAGALAFTAPLAASATPTVNDFTPAGESWVDVPSANRTYFEPFGTPNYGWFYDDKAFAYVPAGITCEYNSVTATGPMYIGIGTSPTCTDSSSNSYDPFDTTDRANAAPFGFTINFFGTDYSSAWPNTNGGVFFDQPSNDYDNSVPYLVADNESTAIFPLSTDQQYSYGESNFWTGNTTIDGHNAVVFSWEHFVNNDTSPGSDVNISYQLVLIDLGNGDFNAWFNYDSATGVTGGYDAEAIWVDLENGVTVGSNIVETSDAASASTECTSASITEFGSATDSSADNFSYYKQESATTISLWNDNSCTEPANITALQDVANDGYAYLEFYNDSDNYSAMSAGWGLYDQNTGKVNWTEFLRNLDRDALQNDGDTPLINMSLNTDVPGRFVLGQRGGAVVDDPQNAAGESSETSSLATTGSTLDTAMPFVGATLAAGLLLLVGARTRGRNRVVRH